MEPSHTFTLDVFLGFRVAILEFCPESLCESADRWENTSFGGGGGARKRDFVVCSRASGFNAFRHAGLSRFEGLP